MTDRLNPDPRFRGRRHPERDRRMNWELTFFRTTEGRRGGSCWGHWGIWHRSARRYIVYLVDGPRLTEFDRLQCARLFCEAIDALTDSSRPHADLFATGRSGVQCTERRCESPASNLTCTSSSS